MIGTSLHTLKLLLPALVPSWRFFDEIAPAPRIEYALATTSGGPFVSWQEFRPKPRYLHLWQMSLRLIWNPVCNENLFLVSCAERLLAHPTAHSASEIFDRIQKDLLKPHIEPTKTTYLKFRLVLRYRHAAEIISHVAYQSDVRKIIGIAAL